MSTPTFDTARATLPEEKRAIIEALPFDAATELRLRVNAVFVLRDAARGQAAATAVFIAKHRGVSTNTVWRWYRTYQREGMIGLIDRRRATRRTARSLPTAH